MAITYSGNAQVIDVNLELLGALGLLTPIEINDGVTGEIVISRAHSDIHDCPAQPPCPDPNNPDCAVCPDPGNPDCPNCTVNDFVTGGGYVVRDGKRVSFGMHSGRRTDGTTFGRLNAVDHSGQHIRGKTVEDYGDSAPESTTRRIVYKCNVSPYLCEYKCNVSPYLCEVLTTDRGEPGNRRAGGVDDWSLSAGMYLAAGSPIEAGNIQLHQPQGCDAQPPTSGGGDTGGGGKGGGKK